jgi:hypothetical protein
MHRCTRVITAVRPKVAAKEVAGPSMLRGTGRAWLGVAADAICIFDTMMDFFNLKSCNRRRARRSETTAYLSCRIGLPSKAICRTSGGCPRGRREILRGDERPRSEDIEVFGVAGPVALRRADGAQQCAAGTGANSTTDQCTTQRFATVLYVAIARLRSSDSTWEMSASRPKSDAGATPGDLPNALHLPLRRPFVTSRRPPDNSERTDSTARRIGSR